MRNKAESKKGQSGQILLYTTIIVMLAALILVPLMEFAFTSHRSAKIREERTLELYASDAGIEDALYQIKTEKKGTDLANLGFGNTSAYNPGTPGMNDRTMDVSVQKVWIPQDLTGNLKTDAPVNNDTTPSLDTDKSDKLVVVGMLSTIQATAASDDFNSGGWTGGNGSWAGNWTHTGSAGIVSSTQGCGGSGYSLGFTDADGTAVRTVNLLKYMKPQLKFTAKAVSLEDDDTVDLNVTYGNSTGNYTETVASWTDGNDTGNCTDYYFDLSHLYGWETGNSSGTTLKISFDANFSTEVTAFDDFNSGDFNEGLNWYDTGSWATSGSGSASVMNDGANAHSPNYDVKLSGNGYVMRRVRLASGTTPEITVWAKQSSFGLNDYAYLQVSTDGTNPSHWSSNLLAWSSSSSPSYTASTYNLSTYAGQTVWIRFSGVMSTTAPTIASDYFESGYPAGGSGWVWSWSTSTTGGTSAGLYTGTTYSHNSNHALQLSRTGSSASGTATATRTVNISGQSDPQIQFYARSRSTESPNDTLKIQISHDGGSTWTSGTTIGATSTYQSFPYHIFTLDPGAIGQSQVLIRFNGNLNRAGSSDDDYFYIDDISVIGSVPCFYFDDVSVTHAVGTDSDSFYVDNLWIVDEYNSNTIEIAYTDPNFDLTTGSPGVNDPAYLDRIGVWMPPGCNYVAVAGNETTVELNHEPTTILPDTYAGGTILEWDYGNVALHQPPGQLPIVKTLTFTYEVDVAQSVEGMFTWIKAHGASGQSYISWDKGYEIYKAVSQAHSEIYGSNTQVTAYAAQGEVNKNGAASYGDYVAAGAALLFDSSTPQDDIKDKAVNPSDPNYWYTYPSPGGFLYDGRDEITSIPSDAKVTAAWLYWSAFMKASEWASNGSQPDTTVGFMYPKRYGPETFAVSSVNLTHIVNAYSQSPDGPYKESIDLVAHEPVLTLSNMRYLGESLGTLTPPHGNVTFFTAHKPISPSLAPVVKVGGNQIPQSGNYTIDYATGNVTIINPNLSGQVKIDYSVSDSKTLVKGIDYTIISDIYLVKETRYKGFTIQNTDITQGKLQGTVTIDYYYAKHWVAVQHAAYDKYGTALSPAQTEVDDPDYGYVGNTYACFADVTELLTGNGAYTGVTGDGQYAVGNVTATPGVPNDSSHHYGTRCFSGWSIIVLYESPTGQAHQFYLWDPIHNKADCPFMVQPNTDSPIQPPCIYVPPYVQVPFTLNNFYPPEGTVSGKLTYFVGEGDADTSNYGHDYIGFKGASKTSYTFLSGPNNPQDNVMNCLSTNGDGGTDIDTYPVTDDVGSDTQANVLLRTQGDRWYLTYMILSFKTNEVPKSDYSFNVASVTYQYELGAQ